jgi:hypothetical protein
LNIDVLVAALDRGHVPDRDPELLGELGLRLLAFDAQLGDAPTS